MSFTEILDRVLEHEGGLVDHPDDPGGITNLGISFRAHPELGRDGIRNLTVEQAREIYHADYWRPLGLDDLQVSDAVKGPIFDHAVNAGQARAVRLLQQTCNLLEGRKRLVVDGQLGPRTKAVTQAWGDLLVRPYTAVRIGYYEGLAAANPRFRTFIRGWSRRARSWLEDE